MGALVSRDCRGLPVPWVLGTAFLGIRAGAERERRECEGLQLPPPRHARVRAVSGDINMVQLGQAL